MSNNKTIVSTVISALVFASMSVAIASTSNDLLRMDLKKSAEQDSIDVTFYTTGNPIDSIVTRKRPAGELAESPRPVLFF